MMQIHPQARTTPAVRAEIARSTEPTSVVARRYGISDETVRKWRKRGAQACQDRSSRPKRLPWRVTEEERARLKDADVVVHDRFLAPQALAHNNFVVIGRREGVAFGPEKVWTGSTNWTDQAWIHWFVDSRIEPVCLTYEALSREPKGALEIILSALDLDPAVAAAIEPKTTKMIDFESQNWASRFRAETDTLCPSDLLGNIP